MCVTYIQVKVLTVQIQNTVKPYIATVSNPTDLLFPESSKTLLGGWSQTRSGSVLKIYNFSQFLRVDNFLGTGNYVLSVALLSTAGQLCFCIFLME